MDQRYNDRTGQHDLVRIFMEYRDSNGDGIHRDQLRGEVLATLIAGMFPLFPSSIILTDEKLHEQAQTQPRNP